MSVGRAVSRLNSGDVRLMTLLRLNSVLILVDGSESRNDVSVRRAVSRTKSGDVRLTLLKLNSVFILVVGSED